MLRSSSYRSAYGSFAGESDAWGPPRTMEPAGWRPSYADRPPVEPARRPYYAASERPPLRQSADATLEDFRNLARVIESRRQGIGTAPPSRSNVSLYHTTEPPRDTRYLRDESGRDWRASRPADERPASTRATDYRREDVRHGEPRSATDWRSERRPSDTWRSDSWRNDARLGDPRRSETWRGDARPGAPSYPERPAEPQRYAYADDTASRRAESGVRRSERRSGAASWLDDVRQRETRPAEPARPPVDPMSGPTAELARELAHLADKADVSRLEEMLGAILHRLGNLEERPARSRPTTSRPASPRPAPTRVSPSRALGGSETDGSVPTRRLTGVPRPAPQAETTRPTRPAPRAAPARRLWE
ncbi:hypothetical protein JCR33_13305 [Acuticoccus sp. 2012]|uniref:Uncharacterized protein n=2 Tax=Acuticoccus mangrovi TaxID=2796142 RepID=A0A934IR01_9HYPH|nr:hypothetical protein [Acuticoccus mangrovi]